MPEVSTFKYCGYDVPVSLAEMTGGGPETFPEIADMHQAALKKWIGLKPTDRVLELGCGIGRDALPLSTFLTSGSYVGVDVIAPSISWLNKNLASKKENFSFHHLDIKDDLHNPGGHQKNEDAELPVDDNSIDKIFLFSVFTHLFASEIEHYLSEFRRVLAPSGKVYATAFVFDDHVLAKARETSLTQWNLRFEYELAPGMRINDMASPRGAVAYDRELFESIMLRSRLRVVRYLNGAWSGYHEQADDGQDVVILEK